MLSIGLSSSPVSLSSKRVDGVPVKVIEVDLLDPRVRVGLIVSDGFPNADESFQSMIAKTKPVAAINGSYFDKKTFRPIGDIAINGKTLYKGHMGTVFVIDTAKRMSMRRVVRHRTYNWSAYETVIACGPALVLEGKIDVKWQEEGFRDPHVTGKTSRMGIGYKSDGTIVMAHIMSAVSFEEMAKVMHGLGCYNAMNLDAGASLAMYANGKVLQAPSRKLTNLFAVWVV